MAKKEIGVIGSILFNITGVLIGAFIGIILGYLIGNHLAEGSGMFVLLAMAACIIPGALGGLAFTILLTSIYFIKTSKKK
ncbi:hypothetical protein [Pseudozobellia thermophila]|uniref:Uncharacterized protein n=1 Tax=Pseudozobellia thermophila TaxID=192903 RepID=A0A1M6M235_9FLAO|nr:hypothetical protein [Pseudozobellia thermophila]SHJ77460.1 hypothetical protein SAMN04488513_108141 [Pseudozobellia thermophila]